ncbi:MAG: alpha/beta fold hydrolase [Sphingobacteriaceae bacterium]
MNVKNALVFWMFMWLSHTAFAQTQAIDYGNNPSAGKYYHIRGFKMYAEVYGKGKPLLMIHGNGGNMAAFSGTIPYFAQRYQVIVADSRAQGKSVDLQDSLSFEMMADDYAALLHVMHVDSADVIGWSDGGINALLLAMRHPEKVAKLAATGANLWPDSTALVPGFWKQEQQDFNDYQHKTLTTPEEKNNYKIFLLDWLQPNIPLSALQKVQCPALIISGDHDLILLEHTVSIYKNIPKANLWVLPNSGHATLKEHEEEFNRKVDDFFMQPFK